MKKTTGIAMLLTGLFLLGGCSGGGEDKSTEVKDYINGALPERYTQSQMYQTEIKQDGDVYTADVVLDMAADGSDFTGYTDEDYTVLGELEANYLLTACLAESPADTTYVLHLQFGEDAEVVVEKPAGQETGTLTYQGESSPVTFG